MTLTQLTAAIDAFLLLNPLLLNEEVVMEGASAYSTIDTPALEKLDNGPIILKRLGNYGS